MAESAEVVMNLDGKQIAESIVDERRERVVQLLDGGPLEHRNFTGELELRDTSDGMVHFTGYASMTETPYPVSDFTETICRNAFKKTLAEDPDVVLRMEHVDLPLARTSSGTLTLTEDVRGLRVDAELDPADPDVQRLIPKMQRGDLTEMSFAFRATKQDWDEKRTDRKIREVAIHRGDVRIVTYGANSASTGTISLRDAVDQFEERSGKVFSQARKDRLQAIKDELDAMLTEAEPAAEPEAAPVVIDSFVPRYSLDVAKARRAKLRRQA